MERKIGKKEFMVLGRLLVKNRPEIARELLLPDHDQTINETNRSLINNYFKIFCELRKADINNPESNLNKFKRARERKIFIAAVLKIYASEVFLYPPETPLLPSGLSKELVLLLQIKKSSVSMIIKQTLYDYKNYEDFRQEIQELVSIIKVYTNGKTQELQN